MPMSANFIGCGRLGRTVARLFKEHRAVKIASILNRSLASTVNAIAFIGEGIAASHMAELLPADFYFITTRDDAIEAICGQLVDSNVLKEGAIVIHCSGSLSCEILHAARTKKCHIASLHPIKSFADPQESIHSFGETYCGIEGDPLAVTRVKTLFEKIGAHVMPIHSAKKSLYHAASVMANNYLVTLHYQAVECYKSSGIDEENAHKIVSMMMNDALVNVKKLPHQDALTGPLQRGDMNTVKKHMDALQLDPLKLNIYSQLGMGTLPLTSHSHTLKDDLKNILIPAALAEV